jgi:hypothetical protein
MTMVGIRFYGKEIKTDLNFHHSKRIEKRNIYIFSQRIKPNELQMNEVSCTGDQNLYVYLIMNIMHSYDIRIDR